MTTVSRQCHRYAVDTDWRDESNWDCNDNVHPSRHGTYGGISMHPYETMFVKESWHVGSHSCPAIPSGAESTVLAGLVRRGPSTRTCTSMPCAMRGVDHSACKTSSCPGI